MTDYTEKERDLFTALQMDDFRLVGGEKTDTTDRILQSLTSVDTYLNSLHALYHLQAAGPDSFDSPAQYEQRLNKSQMIITANFEEMRTSMDYINDLCENYGLEQFMPTNDPELLITAASDYAAEVHQKTMDELKHGGYDPEETIDHVNEIIYETKDIPRTLPSVAEYGDDDYSSSPLDDIRRGGRHRNGFPLDEINDDYNDFNY